jgi:glycosyltransferase involved in cell wall biosynthesis
MDQNKRKIIYVVNVDWFFVSHRLPLAIEALQRGFAVYLITKNTGEFDKFRKLGIICYDMDFERAGKNPLKELKLINQLIAIYREVKPDIIHHVTLKPSIYGTLAAKRTQKRAQIINAVSGLGYTFTAGRRSVSKILLTLLLRFAYYDKKSKFIFQNPDDLQVYKKMGFLNDKNYVLIKGAGVDETKFYLKEKEKNNSGELKVVLVARMLKDKGIFEFINAANLLKDDFGNRLRFMLVGGIDEFNPAAISADTVNKLCDGTYLTWLGHQTNITEIYHDADIVCLPSYREGLPKSLVEAMSVGCPIITTEAIGCRECVDEGINGFKVPIGDYQILAERIKTLVNNSDLRLHMGQESRKKMLREMSLSHVIKKTFEFYAK